MTYEIIWLSKAQADFIQLYAGYGDLFFERLNKTVEILRSYPLAGRRFQGNYRRLLIPQSPYGLVLYD